MKTRIEKLLAHIGHELALLIVISVIHGVLGAVIAHKVMAANGVITVKVQDVATSH